MKALLLFLPLASLSILPLPPIHLAPPSPRPLALLVKPNAPAVWQRQLVAGVKSFEGFKPVPYHCPAGVLTVGYGHTGEAAKYPISRNRASYLLELELKKAEKQVLANVCVSLSPNQLKSLTSFTYNCGEGNLRQLVNGKGRLNSGNYSSVSTYLPKYCKANGQELRGLKKRRQWEKAIWEGRIQSI